MDDDAFADRLARVEKIAAVVALYETDELKVAVYQYLVGAAAPTRQPIDPPKPPEVPAQENGSGTPGAGRLTRTAAKKAKATALAQDKALDLFPSGKDSFIDFATTKAPANNEERYTVCVYWLEEIAGIEKATLNQIYTCYLNANWNVPKDPRNSLHQAGSKSFLETSDSDDIKLISGGMNLVRNTLPRAKASK